MADCGCGDDTPQAALLPFEEAIAKLLEHAVVVDEYEEVALTEALHRTLAENLVSPIDVPPADNSAMDGYAIRTQDVQHGKATQLPVAQRIAAGASGNELAAGSAARIFTGAPVPAGCDAVIMQEQVQLSGDTISFDAPIAHGQNIRLAGEDIAVGSEVLVKGTRLRAQELGLIASIGIPAVKVMRKIRVGIFFTGDELVEPGQPLSAGKIYDSNRYTLNGLLNTMGCEIVDLGIVGDTLEETRNAILRASEDADLVITSGGVSVGEEDHVRIALEQLGELHMWRLKIKPGKPLAFGKVNNTAFIGLPGNPVSAFATFCLFVSPFIKQLQGRDKVLPDKIQTMAAFDWSKADKRREFSRARLQRDDQQQLITSIYHHQGSGVLMSTSWADGFVIIPENTPVSRGDKVDYLSFVDMLE